MPFNVGDVVCVVVPDAIRQGQLRESTMCCRKGILCKISRNTSSSFRRKRRGNFDFVYIGSSSCAIRILKPVSACLIRVLV